MRAGASRSSALSCAEFRLEPFCPSNLALRASGGETDLQAPGVRFVEVATGQTFVIETFRNHWLDDVEVGRDVQIAGCEEAVMADMEDVA